MRVEQLDLKKDVKFRIAGAGFESRFQQDFAKLSVPEAQKPADLVRIISNETKKQVMVS